MHTREESLMRPKEFTALPGPVQRHRRDASLNFLAATCFIVQTIGCMHQVPEQTSSPSKSSSTGKQPVATSHPADMSSKVKSVEKRTPVTKEKRSPAATDAKPDTKPEQPEEPNADAFAPPPPLRPPTFGGAGG
jgi:cell division protein FtsN